MGYSPSKSVFFAGIGALIFIIILVVVVSRKTGTKEIKTNRSPPVELQVAPQPEKIAPEKTEKVEEETHRKTEEVKEKIPVPVKRAFGSSGKTFMEIEGRGCDNNVLSFMSDTTLEICQLVCTSDPECGAFVFKENSDCNTYDTCRRVTNDKTATLFTREK